MEKKFKLNLSTVLLHTQNCCYRLMLWIFCFKYFSNEKFIWNTNVALAGNKEIVEQDAATFVKECLSIAKENETYQVTVSVTKIK